MSALPPVETYCTVLCCANRVRVTGTSLCFVLFTLPTGTRFTVSVFSFCCEDWKTNERCVPMKLTWKSLYWFLGNVVVRLCLNSHLKPRTPSPASPASPLLSAGAGWVNLIAGHVWLFLIQPRGDRHESQSAPLVWFLPVKDFSLFDANLNRQRRWRRINKCRAVIITPCN